MSHHDAVVPLSVVDQDDDGDGELDVSFDWTPGQTASGMSGPPEDYDPGAADEFYIASVSYKYGDTLVAAKFSPEEEDQLSEWLAENWDRPEPDYD